MWCYVLYMLHLAVWEYWIKTWWVNFTQWIAWWKICQSMRCFSVTIKVMSWVEGLGEVKFILYSIIPYYIYSVYFKNKNPKLKRSQGWSILQMNCGLAKMFFEFDTATVRNRTSADCYTCVQTCTHTHTSL